MKKTILVAVLALIFSFPLVSEERVTLEKEKEIIKKVILDYIEGWFEGNADRMDRALHPDLTKRGARKERKTGRSILTFASKSTMVEYTLAGYGKGVSPEQWGIDVQVLDVFDNIACAKALSVHYMDYVHLARHNGQWKIVNVLWTANRPPPPPAEKKDK